MIALERRKRIYEIALTRGAVGVTELAAMFSAAENTIRTDLGVLEQEGKLVRSRGGAMLKETGQPVPPYQQVRDANMLQKSWIAEAAAAYLPRTGSIFINAGSTTNQLALRILDSHGFEVFTNSPEIATYLASNRRIPVSLIGGKIVSESMETDGSFSTDLLNGMYWDAAFVGITAVDMEHGITSINLACAQMEAMVMRNSRMVIGLCDSSKLGRFSRARAGDIEMINVLVTDFEADSRIVEAIEALGVTVVKAGAIMEESNES